MFIRRSLAVILCYAFMLTNTSYGEAASPSLKSQLSSSVAKASANWPKNVAYTFYKTGMYTTYEAYIYGDQLLYTQSVHDDLRGGNRIEKYVFESRYYYQPFPNNFPYGKSVLAKINAKSMDWLRFNTGYDLKDPNAPFDSTKFKVLFDLPIALANKAVKGATSVTYNKALNTYQITGTCDGVKCVTSISFKSDGSLNKIDYQLADGTGWTAILNLPTPTSPFVNRARVIDSETSQIAKY